MALGEPDAPESLLREDARRWVLKPSQRIPLRDVVTVRRLGRDGVPSLLSKPIDQISQEEGVEIVLVEDDHVPRASVEKLPSEPVVELDLLHRQIQIGLLELG